jgi:hypothetical protein
MLASSLPPAEPRLPYRAQLLPPHDAVPLQDRCRPAAGSPRGGCRVGAGALRGAQSRFLSLREAANLPRRRSAAEAAGSNGKRAALFRRLHIYADSEGVVERLSLGSCMFMHASVTRALFRRTSLRFLAQAGAGSIFGIGSHKGAEAQRGRWLSETIGADRRCGGWISSVPGAAASRHGGDLKEAGHQLGTTVLLSAHLGVKLAEQVLPMLVERRVLLGR